MSDHLSAESGESRTRSYAADLSPEAATEATRVSVKLRDDLLDVEVRALCDSALQVFRERVKSAATLESRLAIAAAEVELNSFKSFLESSTDRVLSTVQAQLGEHFIQDHRPLLLARYQGAVLAIIEHADALLLSAIPDLKAYRCGREAMQALMNEPVKRPIRDWVVALHGGQIAMLVAGVSVGFVVAIAIVLLTTNLAAERAAFAFALAAAIGLLVWFFWAVWTWLGARNGR